MKKLFIWLLSLDVYKRQIDDNDIIITNSSHIRGATTYYRNMKCYLWDLNNDYVPNALYKANSVTVNNFDTIQDWAKNNKTIWYFENDNTNSLIESCYNDNELTSEFIGNYKLEFYRINLYEIKSN